ncbi:MAG: hypothetical protein E7536_08835 [Ruminococcaceae bacterium]|nr:hypothetical protein [Oscillospiraceae bacterium]
MKVSFNGFNDKALTFMCGEEITKGYPVKISSKHTVAMSNADEEFIGICLESDNENAVVQVSGYVKMNYSDTVPSLGRNFFICAADGTVKESTDGTPVIVLGVDSTDTTVEFLF